MSFAQKPLFFCAIGFGVADGVGKGVGIITTGISDEDASGVLVGSGVGVGDPVVVGVTVCVTEGVAVGDGVGGINLCHTREECLHIFRTLTTALYTTPILVFMAIRINLYKY